MNIDINGEGIAKKYKEYEGKEFTSETNSKGANERLMSVLIMLLVTILRFRKLSARIGAEDEGQAGYREHNQH